MSSHDATFGLSSGPEANLSQSCPLVSLPFVHLVPDLDGGGVKPYGVRQADHAPSEESEKLC